MYNASYLLKNSKMVDASCGNIIRMWVNCFLLENIKNGVLLDEEYYECGSLFLINSSNVAH